MIQPELSNLLYELCAQPQEEPWLEFKLNIAEHDVIGQYISAISNGATISNKAFGYLVWGIENETHAIKGTQFSFRNAKEGHQDLELWLRHLTTNYFPWKSTNMNCE
ncbi:hypothetical protein AUJ95_02880 [Candidatus Desantisbacteria bacterium CG2_30_40_21]|uniref:Schlafen AlbA-2 domain-containing protein n=4 Tax=unclassified Candidatus Desantisiibacteriota TaxID=3106372 RepID=A0A2M7P1H0_9BACT|nr:MAG: hypothetical protein AUJ95_02880 [Candidatus Desantisbacteria bacterium CG2_30_40_21]PIP41942.1 MAG: hypothetical protein COX18_01995 [Candidatus Desantisbacteria bacterium CG23_combo_of_CG06-09_8_20_14_all_40_23]PIY19460.1 MAG: hypothetical protein COZ13_05230 [Candidatus Desantisbacteria bacterium CG_4_10_14_3_um_filter_40_18]PJB28698.1 MAG: hypothetical protein CO110_08925 [Candidatus Desantisbacteria bacterium CG_4_9_14_3_um_filter_40_11]